MGISSGLPQKLHEKFFQGSAKRRIDDAHFAAPQSQNFPGKVGDIGDIHPHGDSARLDLLIESIVNAIELIRRFGNEER
jgi:hypothetical protein